MGEAQPADGRLGASASAGNRRAPSLRHVIPKVERLEAFQAIFDDVVDGVIWKRELPPSVVSTLETTSFEKGAGSRWTSSPHDVADHVSDFLQVSGLGKGLTATWLVNDISALALAYANLLSVKQVSLRIEVVCDDACRKFHRDAVKARMICTYAGPGTQYGVASVGQEPDQIEDVETGCPIFLKGKNWIDASQGGVLHRSPPIEQRDVSRLVIVIDEAPLPQC